MEEGKTRGFTGHWGKLLLLSCLPLLLPSPPPPPPPFSRGPKVPLFIKSNKPIDNELPEPCMLIKPPLQRPGVSGVN